MDKVDGIIRLPREVRGDFPFGHHCVAPAGEYDAYLNPQGAVAVKALNGELLGIKPDEFEWVKKPKDTERYANQS